MESLGFFYISSSLIFSSVSSDLLLIPSSVIFLCFPYLKVQCGNVDYIFSFFFWPPCIACGILVPNQGSNLYPLQWKCGVLTTGLPGNFQITSPSISLSCFFNTRSIIITTVYHKFHMEVYFYWLTFFLTVGCVFLLLFVQSFCVDTRLWFLHCWMQDYYYIPISIFSASSWIAVKQLENHLIFSRFTFTFCEVEPKQPSVYS